MKRYQFKSMPTCVMGQFVPTPASNTLRLVKPGPPTPLRDEGPTLECSPQMLPTRLHAPIDWKTLVPLGIRLLELSSSPQMFLSLVAVAEVLVAPLSTSFPAMPWTLAQPLISASARKMSRAVTLNRPPACKPK